MRISNGLFGGMFGLILIGQLAAAGESVWTGSAGRAGCGRNPYYGAPACGAPGYGAMTPGCCECPPSCCDHIWDGYCQERSCAGWWRFGCPTILYSPTVVRCESCYTPSTSPLTSREASFAPVPERHTLGGSPRPVLAPTIPPKPPEPAK